VFGWNIDKSKMEVRAGVGYFLSKAFKKFHIVIKSCMRIVDVLQVFPLLMPKEFVDQFMFI
jgi:hypothetical protein